MRPRYVNLAVYLHINVDSIISALGQKVVSFCHVQIAPAGNISKSRLAETDGDRGVTKQPPSSIQKRDSFSFFSTRIKLPHQEYLCPIMTAQIPLRDVLDAIGNTPIVELTKVVPANSARVLVKLESLNPTGSYKDRMAKSVIEEAEKRGTLKPGMTVVEATGGSTGSALAFICAVKGYNFTVVSSDAYAEEKLKTMAAFGADVVIVHSPSGKVTKDLIPAMQAKAAEISKQEGHWNADQFSNPDVLIGYQGMGEELLAQVPEGIDAFCGAVGGAGMTMGVATVLKGEGRQCHVTLLEPASSPAITKGYGGQHSVEGVG